MSFVHGKNTHVTVNAVNLSAFTTNVSFSRSADSHDVTTFGKNSKVYVSGLKDGTATIEGIYDNTLSTGPAAVLRPLIGGAAVDFEYGPEGIAGPVSEVSVIVTSYEETAPVADMVTWSAELQFSDDITEES